MDNYYDESVNPEPEEDPFEYVGELIDPEQTPLTQSVYACQRCGSLVLWSGEEAHKRRCLGVE